ncbi:MULTISPECIES: hypothetical protein [Vibrio]|jgi:hypothetical protein|uniref:Uncharacterized protein n=2 Tax=Vibrio TaxID=662 RepID=A0A2N7I3F9_9VIBR|nr:MULTISPECIES: hypothetical protein [Vibrio]EAQ52011.1 hypothetical protein MED222_02676 [Vibrio sp. MED222]OEF59847.1 hypothetical protein A152_24080 [Vibrio tasmaniensis 1F-187]OEF74254.1 hypothetical protein A162_18535 [Vibrio tasmaniensis 1F-155]PML47955.1 hypothetical protein BCT76_11765 [Vibrio tasmaniensis]PMO74986.1 hypothetical protein BCT01_18320 [Vibrio tasmaniensis]
MKKLAILVVTTLLLTACGGGDSGGGSAATSGGSSAQKLNTDIGVSDADIQTLKGYKFLSVDGKGFESPSNFKAK